jgi:hypothetical protein
MILILETILFAYINQAITIYKDKIINLLKSNNIVKLSFILYHLWYLIYILRMIYNINDFLQSLIFLIYMSNIDSNIKIIASLILIYDNLYFNQYNDIYLYNLIYYIIDKILIWRRTDYILILEYLYDELTEVKIPYIYLPDYLLYICFNK